MMVVKKLLGALLAAVFGFLGYEGTEAIFTAFPSLAAATLLVVGLVVSGFDIESKKIKQTLALVISIAITLSGWLLSLGFLSEYLFWEAALIGLAVGVTAMGLASVDMVKSLLKLFGLLEKQKLEQK